MDVYPPLRWLSKIMALYPLVIIFHNWDVGAFLSINRGFCSLHGVIFGVVEFVSSSPRQVTTDHLHAVIKSIVPTPYHRARRSTHPLAPLLFSALRLERAWHLGVCTAPKTFVWDTYSIISANTAARLSMGAHRLRAAERGSL